MLMKKKRAYPVAPAIATIHHGFVPRLSGRIAKKVTPSRVPAAKLIKAQSGLCDNWKEALRVPPPTAKA